MINSLVSHQIVRPACMAIMQLVDKGMTQQFEYFLDLSKAFDTIDHIFYYINWSIVFEVLYLSGVRII